MLALEQNGQLMVDLVPELRLIIGEQPPVLELPPQQAQSRFQLVFRSFIGVFARPEHPLALFLDDLQWLDAATLDLIEDLLTQPKLRHLLLIGAYRDNEVDATHPLARKLQAIRNAGAKIEEIAVTPLAPEHLGQLIADALRSEMQHITPLMRVVHEKTTGNPFFSNQFISELADEGLLRFEHAAARWSWDLDGIQSKGYTDNVVSLLVGKLARLPDRTLTAIQQLACVGNSAELAMLSIAFGMSEEQVHADLWEAVHEELVERAKGSYKFVHDRVHEAAYSLIPEASRAPAHLRIGRLLAEQHPAERHEAMIFEIVNQLNRGVELITEHHEREQLIHFNLIAGKRAKASTAYAAARNYLSQAAALSSPDHWEWHYERTLDLHLTLSECEYLTGNFAAADELFALIIGKARSDIDRAKVCSLRIKLYQVAGKYHEGLAVALDALGLFGVTFPHAEQAIQAAVDIEFGQVPKNLGERSIGDLVEAPAANDPIMRTVINLLVDAVPCAYIAEPLLFPLITLKAVNLSIIHGNTDQSSFAYGVYSVWLVSVVEDIDAAFQFSEMSLRLNEKFNNLRLRGTLLHLHADHVNFWRRPIETGMPILEKAFRACLEVGDLVYAGFLAFETVWQFIEKGDPLEQILEQSSKYAAFARQSHNDAVYETIRLEQQFVASLQGRTTDPLRFDADAFDEAASFAVIVEATFGCGIVFYHLMKQMLAFLYRRHDEALEAAIRAEPVLGAAMAMPIEASYHFYHALTLAALYPTVSPEEQTNYRVALTGKLRKLEFWAANCPENYSNRYALVAAEIARIEGRDMDAMRHYEDAVRSARENGFVYSEALANELASMFYTTRGFDLIADLYLRNARSCYIRWGAVGKVRQLEALYPQLRQQELAAVSGDVMGVPVDHLDVATVIKVSQAVSSEIVLEKLIDTLMRRAIEHAGAERGLLILMRATELRIVAEAAVADDTVAVRLLNETVTLDALPQSVLHYVQRTRESIILDDASAGSHFAADLYLQQRRARSVLCVPLINQGKLIGMLYLENNLAPGIFVPTRIAVLKLLASQAAISLENTRLYRDLEEREARIRRLVDSNIIGIIIWDRNGRILEANDAFLRMVRYEREDVQAGLRWFDMTPPEWQGRVPQELAELKATGALLPREKEYFRKDASRVRVLIGAAAFEGGSNQGVAYILDLSERERAEAEARESDRRYREVQMELAHANRVAIMGQLTASIAHDINQPIAATVTNAEVALRWLCRQTPDLNEVRAALARIVQDGNRASQIVSRSRELIKKTAPRDDLVDVNQAIRDVVELTRGEAVESGTSMRTQLTDGLPFLQADRVQLQQVILNLVVNGIEAMKGAADGARELLITSEHATAGHVCITVRDTGPGLAPDALDRLFDAFYTTKPGGLGLGLSICRSIVEAHDGKLWATASQTRGAAFHFTLPVKRHPVADVHAPPADDGMGGAENRTGGHA